MRPRDCSTIGARCRRLTRPLAFAVLAAATASTPAAAQDVRLPASDWLLPRPESGAPPKLAVPKLTLADAVRLTVLNDPDIQSARQALVQAVGRERELRGQFDAIFEVDPGFRYLQTELFPALRKNEDDKRRQVLAVRNAFEDLQEALLVELRTAALQQRQPICPIDFQVQGLDDTPFLLDTVDPSESALRALDRDTQSVSGNALEASLGIVLLKDICNPSPVFRSVSHAPFVDFWSKLGTAVGAINQANLSSIINTFGQFPRENVLHAQEIAEAAATRARLALERLGAIPADEVRKNPFFDVSIFKPFRSGLSLTGEFHYESEERNFKEKSLDPSFGGETVFPRFPSKLSFTASVPLLKRRGATSNAASERAAGLSIQAQREQLRHLVTTESFRTVLSYLSLLANQQSLAYLQESAARQRRILELTEQRLQAGDVTRVDVERARARLARVDSSVDKARGSVVDAQYALAENMGVDADSFAAAPTATETLALTSAVQAPQGQNLVAAGLASRRDLRGLQRLADASQALANGAASDLRRTLDLQWTAGMSTLYESPFFRYLPDEEFPLLLDPRIGIDVEEVKPSKPHDSPVRYYSWDGFVRSLDAHWQPFTTITLNLKIPFGNHQAKGRLQQAQASLSQSRIRANDIDRQIRDNIVSVSGVVQRAAQALARTQEALTFQQQANDGTLERFRSGDVTLIDTLTTEETLTQTQIQLVQSWLGYLAAVTRLRYEAGSLVTFDAVDQAGESLRFDPAGLLTR
ncbi:MAG: TolC family protein [Vicinamibacterales bacterium]